MMAVLFISQTQRVSQTYFYLSVKLEGMPLKEGVLHITNGRQTTSKGSNIAQTQGNEI